MYVYAATIYASSGNFVFICSGFQLFFCFVWHQCPKMFHCVVKRTHHISMTLFDDLLSDAFVKCCEGSRVV